jgi:hypothetical protein
MTDPAARAERLGVALRLVAAGQEAIERGHVPITPRDVALAKAVGPEDLALINACLEVEADLREQACAALERLLALLPAGGEGTLSERLTALPQPAFAAAALALMDAGWTYGAPAEFGAY